MKLVEQLKEERELLRSTTSVSDNLVNDSASLPCTYSCLRAFENRLSRSQRLHSWYFRFSVHGVLVTSKPLPLCHGNNVRQYLTKCGLGTYLLALL